MPGNLQGKVRHEHLPVQPACKNDIATQELIDEIDAPVQSGISYYRR